MSLTDRYAILAGIDWSDVKHDLCWKDTYTGKVKLEVLQHTPEKINEWVSTLIDKYPDSRIAVCLEQSRGALINALTNYDQVDIYPINPAALSNYRKAFSPSGAKDDPGDATLMLDVMERHPEMLRMLTPDDSQTRLLRSLCEDRRKAVDMRTALGNNLKSKLKEYFPQALKLGGDQMFSEMTCDFLMKWPTFEAVASARESTVRRFYYAHHSRSEKQIKARLDLIAAGRALCCDPVVVGTAKMWVEMIVKQIRMLNRAIKKYDDRISEVFKNHDDGSIFASLPGAGKQLAPRLLTAFGTNRDRYETAEEVQNYFGLSPVIVRSGKQEWIHWRWHCPKFIRQSVVEFAAKSICFSAWAGIYYKEQIHRGKGHHAAVRALAFKWIRIIFRCWKRRVKYDENTYLASLKNHGSWISERLPQTS